MLVLVVNVGSTSLKFKLLDMDHDGRELSRGRFERIGLAASPCKAHTDVIAQVLAGLEQPPDAIGFKAVHGGSISGAVRVTDEVLAIMERFADAAPAHNPPCIAVMKMLRERLPNVAQVAVFETAFHHTIPLPRQVYAIPYEWTEKLGIRRYGFQGASHRYVATRIHERVPQATRIISCHLGESCSVCAIDHGRSVATSFGMTLQSGVPHNHRVGDFDVFALQTLLKHGLNLEEVFHRLTRDAGLVGMSGLSSDMRDIERGAAAGDSRCKLAIDAFVESVRHHIGACLVALGGCDVLAFTGGIGENSTAIREAICRDLVWAGIDLDANKNRARAAEEEISAVESRAQIWIIPANEESIVARETVAVLKKEMAN